MRLAGVNLLASSPMGERVTIDGFEAQAVKNITRAVQDALKPLARSIAKLAEAQIAYPEPTPEPVPAPESMPAAVPDVEPVFTRWMREEGGVQILAFVETDRRFLRWIEIDRAHEVPATWRPLYVGPPANPRSESL